MIGSSDGAGSADPGFRLEVQPVTKWVPWSIISSDWLSTVRRYLQSHCLGKTIKVHFGMAIKDPVSVVPKGRVPAVLNNHEGIMPRRPNGIMQCPSTLLST